MLPLILIVEDEAPQAEMLRYNLDKAAFRTLVASDGEQALSMVKENAPDLIVLDWMLPKVSGIEVCRHIKARPETKHVPIIMLTARGEEADRVRGLETGADDYVVKPFSPAEMVARVRALLRRSRPALAGESLEYAGIHMNLEQKKVTREGRPIHLGPTDFHLLSMLMERPGRVYSRDQLLDQVWGHDVHVEDRTVDVHIRRLRKALNTGGQGDLIRTVRGSGYAIDEQRDG